MSASAQLAVRGHSVKAELRGEISPKQPKWLTEAIAICVHHTRGTVKRLAFALGVPENAVYAVADINDPAPLKAGWIPDLCRETKSFAVLDVIEAQVGRVAFALPPVNPHIEEMNRELARTLQQFGAFIEQNGDALSDGRLEKHEVGPLLRSIDDSIAGLSEYRALVIEKFQEDAVAR